MNHLILPHLGGTNLQTCQFLAGKLSRRSLFAAERKGAIGTETGYIDGWPARLHSLGVGFVL